MTNSKSMRSEKWDSRMRKEKKQRGEKILNQHKLFPIIKGCDFQIEATSCPAKIIFTILKQSHITWNFRIWSLQRKT